MWKLFKMVGVGDSKIEDLVVDGRSIVLTVTPAEQEYVASFDTIDDVKNWIAQRAQEVGAPKVVERLLADGNYHLIVRCGEIGTLRSIEQSEFYHAREQRAVVLSPAPAQIGMTGT